LPLFDGVLDGLGLALQQDHAIGLDHRVQSECRSCFTLTPTAMTAVNEQRFARQAIAHGAAGAAALRA